MFYVTGDVHADIDGFLDRDFKKIKKTDSIIICGDFGLFWDGNETEKKNAKKLGSLKYKTLFIDGVHENFDALDSYPVTDWNDGKVQVIYKNLIHLMRGQVYNIDGKKIFTFGGGESTDKEMRTEGKTWWEQELPSLSEMEGGVKNLIANNWEVDYIFSYEAPASIKHMFDDNEDTTNTLNLYFDYIIEKCKYKKWVFGNYHKNKRVSHIQEAVYDGVLKLE
jgi:hypothetical protein